MCAWEGEGDVGNQYTSTAVSWEVRAVNASFVCGNLSKETYTSRINYNLLLLPLLWWLAAPCLRWMPVKGLFGVD